MALPTVNIDNLRVLSQIFSPPTIREIVRGSGALSFENKVNNHLVLPKDEEFTNKEIFKATYKQLSRNYRCEYIYKNNLINSLLKEYCLADTVILDEFNIASSKADLVLLNGKMKIFEIKTELDDFTRLSTQLANYQKIADEVNVITDEQSVDKLLDICHSTDIGVMSLSSQNTIKLHKQATSNASMLDFDTIFKVLRKQEFLDLTELFFSFVPDVPNTLIFRECYKLLLQVDLPIFQQEVIKVLKLRRAKVPKLLKSRKTPKELMYVCNALDLSQEEYENLFNFLNQKYYVSSISKRKAI